MTAPPRPVSRLAGVAPLVRMRAGGFIRTGRVLPPLLCLLVALGVIYGGGAAEPAEAYGVSALLLFPILAWQSKLLLDAEPDVQRRLALVTVGSRARELAGGLLAAALAALAAVLVAMIVPWLVGGVSVAGEPGGPALGEALLTGLWAHLVMVPAAVALGALASRAVTRTGSRGVAILVLGAVATIVLGLTSSPVPWLVPPVMATTRATAAGLDASVIALVTTHALAWAAVALAGYGWLRRHRA